MPSSILTSFLGALQASVSVLLTILYGVVGAQFDLLDDKTARRVSGLCVKLFLPSLLLTNIGSQLDTKSADRYLPIIVWGLVYNLLSLAFGITITRLFKLPKWVTPAITFNNTTAMPLLLMQSLGQTSIFESVLWGPHDTISKALARANSYFLVNSMISDSFTFGLGPNLIGAAEEPVKDDDALVSLQNNRPGEDEHREDREEEEEEEREAIRANEETSLLPNPVVRAGTSASLRTYRRGKKYHDMLPYSVQFVLDSTWSFISAPLVGTIIGVIIGIVPPLKKVFFNEPENGGYFKAWITTAVANCGGLFAALQVVVVGVKLDQSLLAMKKGENSGKVGWRPALLVIFVRFILWPAISIPIIWALAHKAGILPDDPMLIFALMIMPTGPSALKLQALTDVAGSSDEEKMGMAKFLTISYVVCPLMSFAVVGALKATQATFY